MVLTETATIYASRAKLRALIVLEFPMVNAKHVLRLMEICL